MSGEAMDGEKDEEIIEPSTADFYACPEMVQGYIKSLESKNAELEKEVERLGSLRAMREVVKEAEELRTRVESEKKRGDEYLAMYQDADRGVVELRTRVAVLQSQVVQGTKDFNDLHLELQEARKQNTVLHRMIDELEAERSHSDPKIGDEK